MTDSEQRIAYATRASRSIPSDGRVLGVSEIRCSLRTCPINLPGFTDRRSPTFKGERHCFKVLFDIFTDSAQTWFSTYERW